MSQQEEESFDGIALHIASEVWSHRDAWLHSDATRFATRIKQHVEEKSLAAAEHWHRLYQERGKAANDLRARLGAEIERLEAENARLSEQLATKTREAVKALEAIRGQQEPVALTDHDKEVIQQLTAVTIDQGSDFWPSMLAHSALRMINARYPAPIPADMVIVPRAWLEALTDAGGKMLNGNNMAETARRLIAASQEKKS